MSRRNMRLHERVAKILGKAEEYQRINTVAPIIVDFVLPNVKNPKIFVLCRSVAEYIEESKTERITPEEMTVRGLNDMFRQLKQAKPDIKTISILSDYNENRFDPDEAEDIADYTDILVINDEVNDLPKTVSWLLKRQKTN